MIFKMYNCDIGIKYKGVNYDFTDVDSLQIEDPETTNLVRGANGENKMGLVYVEGKKQAKTISVTIMNMSAALKAVLDEAFSNKDRLDVYCVDRLDGSKKMATNAILKNQPQQLTVDETAESMNVVLQFACFDITEQHKS